MNKTTLYGKDSKGDLKIWSIWVDGSVYIVEHGKLGGKLQRKVTQCFAKNTGKSNETTAYGQAQLEMDARVTKQLKRGYYYDPEEALAHVEYTPMLAHNHNKYADRITFPCVVQEKLDGLRMLVTPEMSCLSKSGESYDRYVPKDMLQEISQIVSETEVGLDGEVFTRLLSLQLINSAFRKHNDDTPLLEYHVYDIPLDESFEVRYSILLALKWQYRHMKYVKFCTGDMIAAGEDADVLFAKCKEGIIYRNLSGKYEYGKRSYNLIKRKHRQTTEALVLGAAEDKNGQAVLTCELESGKIFECLMLTNADPDVNLRLYENRHHLSGKFIEVEYEALSDEGVPQKPVGQRIRNVDIINGKWSVVE